MAPKLKLLVRPRAQPNTYSMRSASTPEDTIRVQQRLAHVEISDDDDEVEKVVLFTASYLSLTDELQEDDVEEFDFNKEPDEDADDYDDDGLDTAHIKYPNGTLPISSDDEDEGKQGDIWAPPDRAWRSKDFGLSSRHAYETMFFEILDRPMADINGTPDWDVTEDYMRERDHEMLRYLEDHPLPQWVIAQAKAQEAYSRLLERVRWRSLGIRIYNSNSRPGFGTIGGQPFHSVSAQMPPGMIQSRHPSQSMPSPRTMMPPHTQGIHHARTPTLSSNGVGPAVPRRPNGMAPPPSVVLHSQPDAQPMQPGPNGAPINRSAPIPGPTKAPSPSTVAPQSYQTYAAHAHHSPANASDNKGKSRAINVATPPFEALPSRIPTPPYEIRPRPPDRKVVTQKRKNQGKQSQSDVYPWNRQINFKAARVNAVWNDDIYDEATLKDMDAIRAKNAKIIERVDGEENERARLSRVAKKNNVEPSSDTERAKRPDRRRISAPKAKADASPNEQHSGSYSFATDEDMRKGQSLSKDTPDAIFQAYENGEISIEQCADIKICWNAGKKSSMEELERVRFSIKDSLLTREQVDSMNVLVHKAAERIVDFCPDLVWRDMLLRITSEAGYGNKEIRDRLCHNGSYVDKATITKRIGAALGQKQMQTAMKKKMNQVNESSDPADIKTKEHIDEETRYYDQNVADFSNYMEFFGHRTSHRNQLKIDGARKRKLDSLDREGSSGVEEIASSPRLRKRAKQGSAQSPLAVTSSDDTGVDGETEEESEVQADAVSVQSDTILDEMDED